MKKSNKKYMRKYMRGWRKKNPQAWDNYYAKNKEEIRARVKKWQEEHPEKVKEYNKTQYKKRRKARKSGKK